MHSPGKISVKPVPGLRLKSISVLFFLCHLLIYESLAQISEDFSDGNFTFDPVWSGTDSAFMVNDALQLQLHSASAGTSWLSTSFVSGGMDTTVWEFYVKQGFAPSSANFGRFYLASDERDLYSPLNGYFIQFGEAGSNDAPELFRQTGTTLVSVCRPAASGIAASFAIRLKVVRSPDGLWQLFIDYSGGRDFLLEASGRDITHFAWNFTGVFCTYTITNAQRFFYDDIYIRTSPAPDVTPPQIISIEVISSRSLRLVFSEQLEATTAEDLQNYIASPQGGNPAAATLMPDGRAVELSFGADFANGYVSVLRVDGVTDLAGNTVALTQLNFLFFEAKPVHSKDIIFTELMADPSPAVGMPEAEYVEIFNRSDDAVSLAGWKLSDENTSVELGYSILLPGEYLVLASSANAEKFSTHGKTHFVPGFPTLNNTRDVLTLKDVGGVTVDSVAYDISWYRDGEKADGGWSLELIDPENICADKTNWGASESSTGGSAGHQNSIFANNPDTRGPRLVSAVPVSPSTLLIEFDEKLESTIPSETEFAIDPYLAITFVDFADLQLTRILLTLASPMQHSQPYILSIGSVYDCPGNKIQEAFSRAEFLLPGKALPGDVVVNEILFDPRPTGVDFVEVYNRSPKAIDLKGWCLRNLTGGDKSSMVITTQHLLIRPAEYKVFTENRIVLKGEYVLGNETAFFETRLPALNDDEGDIVVLDEGGMVVDSVYYSDSFHSAFLKDNEGVSLERISPFEAGSGPSNWRSASGDAGFATPGYVNSNARKDGLLKPGTVIVEPEVIQAFVNGSAFAQIRYCFERGGFIANVKILDQQGRTVRDIAQNELLGTEGFFRWDGDRDNGAPARTGYYMVWFEIFDERGTAAIHRKRIVVY